MREQLAQRVVDSCEPFAPQSCSLRVPLTKDHHCPWVGNCASLAIQIGSDMTGPLADHERTDLRLFKTAHDPPPVAAHCI